MLSSRSPSLFAAIATSQHRSSSAYSSWAVNGAGVGSIGQVSGLSQHSTSSSYSSLSTAQSWKPAQHPEFTVLQSPTALNVTIPPYTSFVARVDSVVALSAETKVELSTEGGSVNAIARKVSGGDYYYQKFTSDIPQANQVLIAPPGGTSGRGIEVAALVLDGTSELFVKKEALLAYSSRLNVEVIMKGLGMGNTGLFVHRVVGSGPIALSGHGSIVKISLEPNEEFLVDSRRLLAWDSILSPIPQSEIPAPRNPIKSAVSILSRVSRTSGSIARAAWDRISTSMANVTKKGKSSSGSEVESSTKSTSTTNSTSSFNSYFTADNIVKLKSVGVSSASFISNFAIKIFQSTQAKVFGKREMYQLKGPGEFYLSTGYDRYYTSELMMKIPQRVY